MTRGRQLKLVCSSFLRTRALFGTFGAGARSTDDGDREAGAACAVRRRNHGQELRHQCNFPTPTLCDGPRVTASNSDGPLRRKKPIGGALRVIIGK